MGGFLHHLYVLSWALGNYISEDLLPNILTSEVVYSCVWRSLNKGLTEDKAAFKKIMHPPTAFGVRHDTFDVV